MLILKDCFRAAAGQLDQNVDIAGCLESDENQTNVFNLVERKIGKLGAGLPLDFIHEIVSESNNV